jgi:tetratricopeptide (TPR) repeat protein
VKRHLEAGKRHFDLGDVQTAMSHYRTALGIDPECALVHFNLGFALYESQDREGAKTCYKRAIELEPECSLFLEHLAKLHFESEEYQQCVSLFQRANLAGDVQPVSFGLWGRASYELEDYDSAAEQLSRMLQFELTPTLTSYARYYLVLSRLRGGMLFHVRREMRRLLSQPKMDLELLADLGEQLLDSRCISLAKRCLERYLEDSEDMTVSRSYQEIVEIEQKVDSILPRLFSGDEERILQNIHLLFQFGSEKVGRALASIQDATSPLIREAVVEYHLKYGYAFGGDLNRLLGDNTSFVREKCAQYIYQSGSEDFCDAMRLKLADESGRVRRFASLYLRDYGTAEVLSDLTAAMENRQDDEERRQLRMAAAAIKVRCGISSREQLKRDEGPAPKAENAESAESKKRSSQSRQKEGRGIWYGLIVLVSMASMLALLSL